MGTPIAGKSHTSPLAGTEKVPLSPDGYATTQEIASRAFEGIEDLGVEKSVLDGTEWIPGQQTDGTTFHAPASAFGGAGTRVHSVEDADFTVDAAAGTDIVLVSALTAPRVVTLPPASGPAQQIIVKDQDGTITVDNPVTFAFDGADTADPGANGIYKAHEARQIVNDGVSSWVALNGFPLSLNDGTSIHSVTAVGGVVKFTTSDIATGATAELTLWSPFGDDAIGQMSLSGAGGALQWNFTSRLGGGFDVDVSGGETNGTLIGAGGSTGGDGGWPGIVLGSAPGMQVGASSLPTSDPHLEGVFWNNAGVVHVSAG